jgi:hypothetical protein
MQISITVVSKLQTQLQDLINTKFLIFAFLLNKYRYVTYLICYLKLNLCD